MFDQKCSILALLVLLQMRQETIHCCFGVCLRIIASECVKHDYKSMIAYSWWIPDRAGSSRRKCRLIWLARMQWWLPCRSSTCSTIQAWFIINFLLLNLFTLFISLLVWVLKIKQNEPKNCDLFNVENDDLLLKIWKMPVRICLPLQ